MLQSYYFFIIKCAEYEKNALLLQRTNKTMKDFINE